MIIAEVVETKTAFKTNQKDEKGNYLPIGSIQIRIGASEASLGQVRNVYARPATFNKRIPLIGEQVLVFLAPAIDWSTDGTKSNAFLYLAPYNATDDLVLHQFPKLWLRSGPPSKSSPQRKSDKKEPGYTFPKIPRKTDMLQPYEGDDIFEGRFGQSIRFGTTSTGDTAVYELKTQPWKGGDNTDPIIAMRVKKPTKSGDYGKNFNMVGGKYTKKEKYTLEDIGKDESSIYLTSTQKIPNFKPGFSKNLIAKQAPNWSSSSQIVVDSGRVVVNAKNDSVIIIGKDKAIVTGKKVILQSDKYNVDLDDLMDFIKSFLSECTNLAQGSAQYATSCGPTSVATNMGQFLNLKTATWTSKFKKL
jgi:hypothetical protein